MIYPKKIKASHSELIIKLLIVLSILVAILLSIINKLTTPNVPWAALSNSGIIYIWLVVKYSIKKNINIAGHVLFQTIAISALTIYIDYKIGFKGWSFSIAIPIITIISNITMLILTIVSYKRYLSYAIYQLIILLFSIISSILIIENIEKISVLCIIGVVSSLINFILTLILSSKDLKESIIRKFHI